MALKTLAPWADAVVERDRLVTAEELLQLPEDGWLYELVEGYLVKLSPAGGGHGHRSMRLGAELYLFNAARHLGVVFAAETGFRLNLEGAPDTVLAPDAAFVRADRVPPRDSPDYEGYWRLAPDLVVEVASPGQTRPELAAKARLWLAGGTRLVWVVWPAARAIDVWRAGADQPTTLGIADTLDGEDVLPRFRYSIRDLFS